MLHAHERARPQPHHGRNPELGPGEAPRCRTPPPLPQRIAVIGAGMVGLSTAWYLQEQGAEVSVIESTSVAAGSSWGNAGWLTRASPPPARARRAAHRHPRRPSPSSPVYVPPKVDANLARFVAGFTRNSTAARWRRNMAALVPVNRMALDAFDELSAGGVQEPTRQASSFIAAYQRVEQRRTLLEIEHIGHAGQEMSFEALTGDEARAIEPVLSDEIRAAILLRTSASSTPARMSPPSPRPWRRAGADLTGLEVMAVDDRGESVILRGTRGWAQSFDSVVPRHRGLARGARPPVRRAPGRPGRPRLLLQRQGRRPAGRAGLPARRPGRLHAHRRPAAGRGDDGVPAARGSPRPAPHPGHRRGRATLLRGVDLDDRTDEWVGSRPCTVDGLPLIGATRSPRVHVAGGPQHVGHHSRPGHGQAARRADHDRDDPGRAPPSTRCAEPPGLRAAAQPTDGVVRPAGAMPRRLASHWDEGSCDGHATTTLMAADTGEPVVSVST